MTLPLTIHLLCDIWGTVGIIFWIIVALIAWAFREELIQIAVFIGVFMGIGALLFWWWFDNASLGATVGFGFAVFIGLRLVLNSLGAEFSSMLLYAYYFFTFPLWLLNRIQLILTGPWRYPLKYVWLGESSRNFYRPVFYVLQILLYIVTTPLRLLNAILYNIFLYNITELYDLFYEVLEPTRFDEGEFQGAWKWMLWLPYRLIKYPIFHGSLVIIESVVWTIVDIFIPTITLYHGTDLNAAKAITGSAKRNISLWNNWLSGTFKASDINNAWGGMGVYFASSRQVVISYSQRAITRTGGVPVFMACRVSLGKIINYGLAPQWVASNTGGSGNPVVLNRYADEQGYTSAEWWNGSYWEYCMFDWQNRYNYPWRIRPLYVLNLHTDRAQHIDGGMRHWLFDPVIFESITDSFANSFKHIIWMCFCFILLIIGYRLLHDSSCGKQHETPSSIQYESPSNTESDHATSENVDTGPITPLQNTLPAVNSSNRPSSSYTPRAVQRNTYQRTKATPKQRKKTKRENTQLGNQNSTGFRLEKVDRIPTSGNNNTKGQGFHFERVE